MVTLCGQTKYLKKIIEILKGKGFPYNVEIFKKICFVAAAAKTEEDSVFRCFPRLHKKTVTVQLQDHYLYFKLRQPEQ